MQYGVLPGGGSPKCQKKSPVRVVAGHLYAQIRRPSRFRGRLLFTVFGLTALFFLIYGRNHAVDLSQAASSFKDYIPDSITDVIAQYGDFEEQRWDDEVDPEDTTQRIIKKPKFHLLIPAKQPTENLCKTLLSAAILNYPPPTLISYGNMGKDTRPGADVVKNIFTFLHGKEAHDNDLILVVEEDAWFQLPAQVTINRFFHGLKDSNAKLLEKYGGVKYNTSDGKTLNRHQKYTMKVLFGSGKECTNSPSDPACYSVPESPLPKDIYGDETDRHPEGKYNRPRYMSGAMVMGRVNDLRPIYKEASEMLEFDEIGKRGSQYIFSEIFGIQEYARTLSLASAGNGPSKWISWLSSVLSKTNNPPINPPNITLKADKNYEFGIGLDYFSSIFQVMNNSAEDLRFVRFNHPSVIASPSRISAKAFRNPIRLPPDLALAPPPFFQNQNSAANPDPPITELDNMHDDSAGWPDIELSTNVIIPGSSVPASLNFDGSEYLLDGEMWQKMWFHPNARALMRQYMRSPDGPIAASAAASGGDKWWDLRGGKGGVWTDRGEWLEWNEVCGAFDEKVFGDDKGEFMREKEEVGGQKVVYKFGQVVEGKLPKPKPANMEAHKTMVGDAHKAPETKEAKDGKSNTESNPSNPHKTPQEDAAKTSDQKVSSTDPPKHEQEPPTTEKGLSGQVIKVGEGIHLGSETAPSEKPIQVTQKKPLQDSNSNPNSNQAQAQVKPNPHAAPSNADSKPPDPPISTQHAPILQAEGGQAIIGGQGIEGIPMSIGGGMQVSGTLDLNAVKLASEKTGGQGDKASWEVQGKPFKLAGEKSFVTTGDPEEEDEDEDEKKAKEIIKATEGKGKKEKEKEKGEGKGKEGGEEGGSGKAEGGGKEQQKERKDDVVEKKV